MKRFLYLIIALSIIIFSIIFSSCTEEIPVDTSSIPDTTVSESQPVDEDIIVFAPGVCEYRIVYPSDDTDDEFKAARDLQALIEKESGVKPEIVRSHSVGGDKADANAKEILLSFVDFEEFDVAISSIPYGAGVACAVGNKIVVTGHEREGFMDAFESFTKCIEESVVDGKCVLPADFWSTCESSGNSYFNFKNVPGYPGGKIEDFSNLDNRHYQVTIYDTDADMYEAYEKVLEDDGYSFYSENVIAGNTYSTYTKGKEMIYYYYCPVSNETRVIMAENAKLPALEAPEYKKICDPAYVSIAIYDENGKVSGDAQGAIIRLEDGTFLVYDGGNNNSYQAKQIYDVLRDLAPDKDHVTVRAWIFSHYHGDHTGTFMRFAGTYPKTGVVNVESFIYNFCNTKEQTQCLGSSSAFTKIPELIRSGWGDVPIYKCLTGQVYHFPGMDMEILATMSDFIPRVIGFETSDADKAQGDGNSMSIVVRLNILETSTTCMLTGDATNIVLDDMVKRYGNTPEYLDSDIVTTPHHAHNRDSYRARNATKKFYDAVKPDILVVTCSTMSKFAPTSKYPYEVNVYLLKTYDPEIYLMNQLRLINMATLKEIK